MGPGRNSCKQSLWIGRFGFRAFIHVHPLPSGGCLGEKHCSANTHTHTHAHMYIVCMYAHMYVHAHTRTHTVANDVHTHAHTDTRAYSPE